MRHKLTASFVKTAVAEPGAERTIFWDETFPSFGLMVTSSGHRSWVVQYRNGQTSRRLTLKGVLSLDDARKQAKAILGQAATGGDPLVERRKAADSGRDTLRAIVEQYFAREGGNLRSAARRRATLERLVFPKFGPQRIHDIKRSDIIRLLDKIEDERGQDAARQVFAFLRQIFNWYAIRDDDFRSPVVPGMMKRQNGDRGRERVLSDDELRQVWTATEKLSAPWGAFVRLLLLTAARRTEVAQMKWSEIADGVWTIPAERVKTGTEVKLPLSASALKLLAGLPRVQDCGFVFSTNGSTPISGFSTLKLRLDLHCGINERWTLHDLRRTARSLMSRAGVNPDIAERCLGHTIGGVRGVYDRHKYTDEMRDAFEALAAQID